MYKGEKPYKVLQKNLARKDNMTYEQAKELKDAGLKQKHGRGTRFIYPDGSLEIAASDQDKQSQEAIYIPTLPELIDACGEWFSNLFQKDEGKWKAIAIVNLESGESREGYGETHIEAVRKLYIALNK